MCRSAGVGGDGAQRRNLHGGWRVRRAWSSGVMPSASAGRQLVERRKRAGVACDGLTDSSNPRTYPRRGAGCPAHSALRRILPPHQQDHLVLTFVLTDHEISCWPCDW